MTEFRALLLSDHLMDALAALYRARKSIGNNGSPVSRETVLSELTQAEVSISRIVGLLTGADYGRPD